MDSRRSSARPGLGRICVLPCQRLRSWERALSGDRQRHGRRSRRGGAGSAPGSLSAGRIGDLIPKYENRGAARLIRHGYDEPFTRPSRSRPLPSNLTLSLAAAFAVSWPHRRSRVPSPTRRNPSGSQSDSQATGSQPKQTTKKKKNKQKKHPPLSELEKLERATRPACITSRGRRAPRTPPMPRSTRPRRESGQHGLLESLDQPSQPTNAGDRRGRDGKSGQPRLRKSPQEVLQENK